MNHLLRHLTSLSIPKSNEMNELFSVDGKVVVITGGTGVLGACIGEYLAMQGAKVVLMGRRKDEGDKLVKEITDKVEMPFSSPPTL